MKNYRQLILVILHYKPARRIYNINANILNCLVQLQRKINKRVYM
jgi:hypothetical protein